MKIREEDVREVLVLGEVKKLYEPTKIYPHSTERTLYVKTKACLYADITEGEGIIEDCWVPLDRLEETILTNHVDHRVMYGYGEELESELSELFKESKRKYTTNVPQSFYSTLRNILRSNKIKGRETGLRRDLRLSDFFIEGFVGHIEGLLSVKKWDDRMKDFIAQTRYELEYLSSQKELGKNFSFTGLEYVEAEESEKVEPQTAYEMTMSYKKVKELGVEIHGAEKEEEIYVCINKLNNETGVRKMCAMAEIEIENYVRTELLKGVLEENSTNYLCEGISYIENNFKLIEEEEEEEPEKDAYLVEWDKYDLFYKDIEKSLNGIGIREMENPYSGDFVLTDVMIGAIMKSIRNIEKIDLLHSEENLVTKHVRETLKEILEEPILDVYWSVIKNDKEIMVSACEQRMLNLFNEHQCRLTNEGEYYNHRLHQVVDYFGIDTSGKKHSDIVFECEMLVKNLMGNS